MRLTNLAPLLGLLGKLPPAKEKALQRNKRRFIISLHMQIDSSRVNDNSFYSWRSATMGSTRMARRAGR